MKGGGGVKMKVNYRKLRWNSDIEVRGKAMDMATNAVLLPGYSKDSHCGNGSCLSSRHTFHRFVCVVINIQLLEGEAIFLLIQLWRRRPGPFV